ADQLAIHSSPPVFPRSSFECSAAHPDLPSFPNDALPISNHVKATMASNSAHKKGAACAAPFYPDATWIRSPCRPCHRRRPASERSEEHTSELQSRENLVCRLLLEKKNEC